MKKRAPLKHKSLVRVMLWSYVLHALTVILAILATVSVTVLILLNLFLSQDQTIQKQEALLKRKAFDRISPEELGAGNRGFEVLGQDGQVIYSTVKDGASHYQQEEIDLMSAVGSEDFRYWAFDSLRTKAGRQEYMLSRVTGNYRQVGFQSVEEQSAYIILDEQFQVVRSSFLAEGIELKNLGRQFSKNISLWKYAFTAEDGQKLTLVLHKKVNQQETSGVNLLAVSGLGALILIYMALSFLFALRMRRKIYRPLTLLKQAIKGLTDKSSQQIVDYQGPAEFTEIVTDFNKVAQDLYQSEAERQKLQAERQRLLADISHDLKTPITVIQGYAKAVRDGLVSPGKQQLYLETIYQKAEKLDELIKSFHDYSQIEHPEFSLTAEPVDFCELIRLYMVQHYAEFDLAGFQLAVDIPAEPIAAELDRQQFERVLDNLLTNFFKHNPKGSTLFVTVSQQDGGAALMFADDGTGISGDQAQTLFSPFVTGDAARGNQAGSGLGLAIAKKIMEAHGGSISLQHPPEPPYKTAFLIRFPAPS